MSALPPKIDIGVGRGHVRYGPIADIATVSIPVSTATAKTGHDAPGEVMSVSRSFSADRRGLHCRCTAHSHREVPVCGPRSLIVPLPLGRWGTLCLPCVTNHPDAGTK